MARTSSSVRGELNGKRGSIAGSVRARRGRRGSGTGWAARIEPLEGRQLLSVSLVSVTAAGQAAGAIEDSEHFAISDNGQFVVFTSIANAVDFGTGAADDSTSRDVFLNNLTTGAVTLVSGTSGVARGGEYPSISSDGRYVAFSSVFGGFASGGVTDTNGSNDIYILDTSTGGFIPVSINAAGTGMAGSSIQPSVSNNGRIVAYVSATAADQIVTGASDPNGTARDVFVRNLDTNVTTLISASTAGATTTGNGRAEEPSISADGSFVAFMSQATDLSAVPDATAATDDIFRRAVAGTTTDLVSVGTVGGSPGAIGGFAPTISGDGNLVAFASASSNVVPGDSNSSTDVFIRNLSQGTTEFVSVTQAGALGQGNSINPSISENGGFVAFQTSAANLVAPGTNATGNDIMIKNRTDGSLVRASQTDAGEPASAGGAGVNSSLPEINADGTAVAFFSLGTNLVPATEDPAIQDVDLFAWRSAAPVPVDTTPPTAAISAPAITAESAAPQQVTIVYADNAAVDVSGVGIDDISVTGPAPGTTALSIASAVATPSTNAASVSVVYTITPTGGTWDATDNGTYTITLPAGAVRDTAANGVAAGSGTFAVNISGGGGTTGPGPDLIVAIAPKPVLPTAVVGGSRGRMRLVITNQGDQPVASTGVTVLIRAVPTGSTTGAPIDITAVTRPLRLRAARSRPMPVKFLYPAGAPDGTYSITATVDATGAVVEGNEANNTTASAVPVTIAAPFVDLTAAVGAPARGALTLGRRARIPVSLTNGGNVTATGLVKIDVFASTDAIAGGADDILIGTITRPLKLRNGRPRAMRVGFIVPAELPAGPYFLTAAVDTNNGVIESNESNNTTVGGAPVQVA